MPREDKDPRKKQTRNDPNGTDLNSILDSIPTRPTFTLKLESIINGENRDDTQSVCDSGVGDSIATGSLVNYNINTGERQCVLGDSVEYNTPTVYANPLIASPETSLQTETVSAYRNIESENTDGVVAAMEVQESPKTSSAKKTTTGKIKKSNTATGDINRSNQVSRNQRQVTTKKGLPRKGLKSEDSGSQTLTKNSKSTYSAVTALKAYTTKDLEAKAKENDEALKRRKAENVIRRKERHAHRTKHDSFFGPSDNMEEEDNVTNDDQYSMDDDDNFSLTEAPQEFIQQQQNNSIDQNTAIKNVTEGAIPKQTDTRNLGYYIEPPESSPPESQRKKRKITEIMEDYGHLRRYYKGVFEDANEQDEKFQEAVKRLERASSNINELLSIFTKKSKQEDNMESKLADCLQRVTGLEEKLADVQKKATEIPLFNPSEVAELKDQLEQYEKSFNALLHKTETEQKELRDQLNKITRHVDDRLKKFTEDESKQLSTMVQQKASESESRVIESVKTSFGHAEQNLYARLTDEFKTRDDALQQQRKTYEESVDAKVAKYAEVANTTAVNLEKLVTTVTNRDDEISQIQSNLQTYDNQNAPIQQETVNQTTSSAIQNLSQEIKKQKELTFDIQERLTSLPENVAQKAFESVNSRWSPTLTEIQQKATQIEEQFNSFTDNLNSLSSTTSEINNNSVKTKKDLLRLISELSDSQNKLSQQNQQLQTDLVDTKQNLGNQLGGELREFMGSRIDNYFQKLKQDEENVIETAMETTQDDLLSQYRSAFSAEMEDHQKQVNDTLNEMQVRLQEMHNAQLTALNKDKETLRSSILSGVQTEATMKKQNERLDKAEIDLTNMSTKIEAFKKAETETGKKYDQLKGQLTTLESKVDTKKANYDQLSKNYNSLTSRVVEIEKQLQTDKTERDSIDKKREDQQIELSELETKLGELKEKGTDGIDNNAKRVDSILKDTKDLRKKLTALEEQFTSQQTASKDKLSKSKNAEQQQILKLEGQLATLKQRVDEMQTADKERQKENEDNKNLINTVEKELNGQLTTLEKKVVDLTTVEEDKGQKEKDNKNLITTVEKDLQDQLNAIEEKLNSINTTYQGELVWKKDYEQRQTGQTKELKEQFNKLEAEVVKLKTSDVDKRRDNEDYRKSLNKQTSELKERLTTLETQVVNLQTAGKEPPKPPNNSSDGSYNLTIVDNGDKQNDENNEKNQIPQQIQDLQNQLSTLQKEIGALKTTGGGAPPPPQGSSTTIYGDGKDNQTGKEAEKGQTLKQIEDTQGRLDTLERTINTLQKDNQTVTEAEKEHILTQIQNLQDRSETLETDVGKLKTVSGSSSSPSPNPSSTTYDVSQDKRDAKKDEKQLTERQINELQNQFASLEKELNELKTAGSGPPPPPPNVSTTKNDDYTNKRDDEERKLKDKPYTLKPADNDPEDPPSGTTTTTEFADINNKLGELSKSQGSFNEKQLPIHSEIKTIKEQLNTTIQRTELDKHLERLTDLEQSVIALQSTTQDIQSRESQTLEAYQATLRQLLDQGLKRIENELTSMITKQSGNQSNYETQDLEYKLKTFADAKLREMQEVYDGYIADISSEYQRLQKEIDEKNRLPEFIASRLKDTYDVYIKKMREAGTDIIRDITDQGSIITEQAIQYITQMSSTNNDRQSDNSSQNVGKEAAKQNGSTEHLEPFLQYQNMQVVGGAGNDGDDGDDNKRRKRVPKDYTDFYPDNREYSEEDCPSCKRKDTNSEAGQNIVIRRLSKNKDGQQEETYVQHDSVGERGKQKNRSGRLTNGKDDNSPSPSGSDDDGSDHSDGNKRSYRPFSKRPKGRNSRHSYGMRSSRKAKSDEFSYELDDSGDSTGQRHRHGDYPNVFDFKDRFGWCEYDCDDDERMLRRLCMNPCDLEQFDLKNVVKFATDRPRGLNETHADHSDRIVNQTLDIFDKDVEATLKLSDHKLKLYKTMQDMRLKNKIEDQKNFRVAIAMDYKAAQAKSDAAIKYETANKQHVENQILVDSLRSGAVRSNNEAAILENKAASEKHRYEADKWSSREEVRPNAKAFRSMLKRKYRIN